jgi:hypothetical protein
MSNSSLCFLVFRHGRMRLQLDSALQGFAIVTLLLLQLLVLLSKVLSDLTVAESTASRIDALLRLLFIVPALSCCRVR